MSRVCLRVPLSVSPRVPSVDACEVSVSRVPPPLGGHARHTHTHGPTAEQLNTIADRLLRLSPSHRDPHQFHETKSELVDELRRLARRGVAA